MKSYKEFPKCYIGSSDIASLIGVGIKPDGGGLSLDEIHFGGDGSYYAYIVEGEAEIGAHYKLVSEYTYWFKIYDDETKVLDINARSIKVYRAGDSGCIVQYFPNKKIFD